MLENNPAIKWAGAAVVAVGLITGAWAYMEDVKRGQSDLADEIRHQLKIESEWKDEDAARHEELVRRFQATEESLALLQQSLAAASDDLNYRLGMHVGDHRVLEDLIQRKVDQ